jgi:hypothetical protein
VDLVAHCGGRSQGGCLYTITLTDVATGWTECLPLLNRGREAVLAALRRARASFPFPILGLDTDNGGEFINEEVADFCVREQITFTRGRPYEKRDQCFVEQKMGWSCARWWVMTACLGSMPIANWPNCTAPYIGM